MTKVSIIIRSYNEEKHIARLLSGIVQQRFSDYEIILVDSGSTDATLSIAKRYPVKIVHIDSSEFSFGRALNRGCKVANGEYLVFASAHVYPVFKDWLESLIKPFDDPNVALVYGKQRGDETTKYSEKMIFKRWFPGDSSVSDEEPFCNNANAAIRKNVWECIQYDEQLTGLEDLDWAQKAIARKMKIAYNADAEVIHVHRERYRQVKNRYQREAIAFRRICKNARFGLIDLFFLSFSNIINDYIHALKDHVFLSNIIKIPGFRLMQFCGTYIGYRQHKPITRQLAKRFYYPGRLDHLNDSRNNCNASKRIDYAGHSV
jgi:rhamnosyltransferase